MHPRGVPFPSFLSMQWTMSLNPPCERSEANVVSLLLFLSLRNVQPACKKSLSVNLASFLNFFSGASVKAVYLTSACKRSFARTRPLPPLFPLPIKMAMGSSPFVCTKLNSASPACYINNFFIIIYKKIIKINKSIINIFLINKIDSILFILILIYLNFYFCWLHKIKIKLNNWNDIQVFFLHF